MHITKFIKVILLKYDIILNKRSKTYGAENRLKKHGKKLDKLFCYNVCYIRLSKIK
jgi:hypothetical protein